MNNTKDQWATPRGDDTNGDLAGGDLAGGRPIKLVAIDLDGTLLGSDGRISESNIQAVRGVLDRGVHVVLASARPPRAVREFYELLDLVTPQVNYNGALIHDPHRREHLYHQPLDPGLAKRVFCRARKVDPEVIVNIEILDQWHTDRVDPTLEMKISQIFEPDYFGPLDACLATEVTKVMLMAPPERIGTIREMLDREFADQVALAISDPHLIQVVHRRVDKAHAVGRVAGWYGVDRQSVLAIGDAPNDIGMIRWAGVGVAVGNAWEGVRQVADAVVASNDDDGVAQALTRYVLDE